ncbi:MAG: isoleucine--tRNA ligase [Bacteroidales bacterium]
MSKKFPEYKQLDLPGINLEMMDYWLKNDTFHKSLEIREGYPDFIFYEGPPSANGLPGIHHVMARAIKDIFCRYKTQKGYRVLRKAGWDTHGLPVELGVEKMLGITKDDIGKTISVADYNAACRREVLKYTTQWEDLTHKMGYWVDMDHPYITYDNRYIETLWWILKEFYNKGLLYKGYTIQPYSPAAGTGLSSHELNQPGCYRDVKDTTVTALFEVNEEDYSKILAFAEEPGSKHVKREADSSSASRLTPHASRLFFLAWTTTPWTLPSNTALCVGPDIRYVLVDTVNPYSGDPIRVILAKELVRNYFDAAKHPFEIISEFSGRDLEGIGYKQLINWVRPMGDAFRVILGDFVTTEDGTGIVHIAPTFGADDDRVARQTGITPLLVYDADNKTQPLVDRKGRFFPIENLEPEYVSRYINQDTYSPFAGRYVKNEYDEQLAPGAESVDVEICVMLKQQGRAFRIEKHVHNYPHCWRTDKPILYYPLDSWFIKTTAVKDRMIELNRTINWKPESTGTGRFGNWLENLVDWNLSRSRYWGTPLPIWATENSAERKCIGSVSELKSEIDKAVAAGFMTSNPLADFVDGDNSGTNYSLFDLHRPYVDDIFLVSDTGNKMSREPDLIDVWFDSGAMPFAQLHYPFEHKEDLGHFFPADFIAEGVDQTRGWFFTLHAIAVMLFDSVSFKNLVSNGLILDKDGNKMSKRLGNSVDPFEIITNYGSDPLRWYLVTNSPPWDNLKFDLAGVDEVKRKFFGTLYNTYAFFSLYANVDHFCYEEPDIQPDDRPELDRWILSLLNSLIREVDNELDDYSPTRAARAIQDFVLENLSNWYVRLSRKRFWGGDYDADKISAYQTLYTCLETVTKLAAPIIPFYTDRLFLDLNSVTGRNKAQSIHLTQFPVANAALIDGDLEERMALAQRISSAVLGLRRKVNIKVRQPLQKIMIPVMNERFGQQLRTISDIIKTEINVKEISFLDDTSDILVKKIKPNFKMLGKKYGKQMKEVSEMIGNFSQAEIASIEKDGSYTLNLMEGPSELLIGEVEIISEDIPGWLVANDGNLTIALDIMLTDELIEEGTARELINRIQNIRKDSGFEVTDKISILIQKHAGINGAVQNFGEFIANQTLAIGIKLVDRVNGSNVKEVELDDEMKTFIQISRI